MTETSTVPPPAGSAFGWGAVIGVTGGLIGLGGAEFRLPVLMGVFRLPASQAVRTNLVVSLVTVVFSLVFRTAIAGHANVLPYAPVMLNVVAGSLVGAFAGTHFASRMLDRTLTRVMSVCLGGISIILISHTFTDGAGAIVLADTARFIAALSAGAAIGVTSSLLGIAGGELIIPTLVVLFGIEVKLAGSLSLMISIPTLVVGMFRYNTLQRQSGITQHPRLVTGLASGSVVGSLIGSALVPYVPGSLLAVILGIILLVSAVRLYTQGLAHP